MLFGIRLVQPDSFTFTRPSTLPPTYITIFFERVSKRKALIKCRVGEVRQLREQTVQKLADGIDLLRYKCDGETLIATEC